MNPTPDSLDPAPRSDNLATHTPPAAPTLNPAASERAARALSSVDPAIRLHNLWLMLAFITALGAMAYKYQTHTRIESTTWLRASEVLRVVLPIGALILTGTFTSRRIRAALVEHDGSPTIELAGPVFADAKRISTVALGLALLVNVAFLATGSRVADFLLAGFAAFLFLTTRPSARGLISFTAMLKTIAAR